MDANVKKYLVVVVISVIVIYALAHVDTLREKVLGLPPISV